jgi:hypothetical protein
MTGTLVAVYNASAGAARKKFDDCWVWLYSASATTLKTTRVSQADRVLFLINQIPSVTAGIRNSFYALGGGRPYKDDNSTTYDAQRTQYEADAAVAALAADLAADWAAVQNQHINAAVYVRADLVAGLRAAADQLEANL